MVEVEVRKYSHNVLPVYTRAQHTTSICDVLICDNTITANTVVSLAIHITLHSLIDWLQNYLQVVSVAYNRSRNAIPFPASL